jgi:hypothetical protein
VLEADCRDEFHGKNLPFSLLPVIVIEKEINMELNEAFLNEIALLRQTLERIATSLEDIDDTLEIMFLMDDYDEEDLEELELLDSFDLGDEFEEEDKEIDED